MAVRLSPKDAAAKIIAVKDRTEKELIDKLSEKGYDEKEIAEAMAFAVEYGYIDDRAYTKKYISDGINVRNHGFGRIRTELLRRGIDRCLADEEIELAKEAIEVDFGEKIDEIMERRFSGADLSNPKERNRIFGYFARRGYAPNEIWGAINRKSAFKDISSEEF